MLNRRNGRCRYTQRQQQQRTVAMSAWDAVMSMTLKKGDPEAGIEPGTSFEALPERLDLSGMRCIKKVK